jgi:hypothetical protein
VHVVICSTLPDDPSVSLTALGVSHGELLFMAYDMERQVESVIKKGLLDNNRPFGSKVTVSWGGWDNGQQQAYRNVGIVPGRRGGWELCLGSSFKRLNRPKIMER